MSEDKPKLHIESDWKSEAQAEKDRLAAEEKSPSGLHVDSDWKAEAQAEKERLAAKEEENKDKAGDGQRGLPEASFSTLMSVLASQAIMGLGTMRDQQTGGVMVDLEGAKFSIDLLGVLEEKSKGNLTEQESTDLTQLLSELRGRFVQISELVAKSATGGPGIMPEGGPAGPLGGPA